MAMDASIILQGQTPDILGAMDRGRQAAENQINLSRQNALAQLYKSQGAGILAGDQGALNALAGVDPSAAMAAQSNLLGIQGQRQDLAFSAEEMQMKRDAAKASATEALAAQQDKLTAGQLAAEAKAMSDALSGAAFFYQNKDEAGYSAFLQKSGIDPAEFPFAEFPAHAASVEGVLEAMKTFQPAEPVDEYGRYVAEQTAKGQAPLDRIGFENAKKGNGVTTTTRNADGSETTVQVGGAAVTGQPTSGDALRASMTDAESVVSLIDEIAKDPALAGVTGSLEGGGGNNVDEFSGTRRAYYGDAGLAVIQKIAQLQGNAWLGARALLKGGGAITDYESRKAEAAMARLSRAQGDKEFQAALNDLKVAIQDGMAKLQGADSGSPQVGAAPSFEDAMSKYGAP